MSISVVTNVPGTIQGTSVINGVTNTTSIPTNYPITNTFAVEPYGSNSVNDSVYMNGSFDGNVQNSYPNQTFTAYGTLTQQQLAEQPIWGANNTTPPPANGAEGMLPMQVSSTTISITVQGVRIAETYTSFNTVNNQSNVPYSTTYYGITNLPGKAFSGQ